LAITRAVIPAAGKGTRLYPATKSQAKEMLPLGTKPVIQHVVEELAASGITEILIVTGQKKRAIEDHFDADASWMEVANGQEVDAEVWQSGVRLFYTRQSEPLGLGDAVSRARAFCERGPFVVALGDALVYKSLPGPAVIQRLIETFEGREAGGCVATYRVSREETRRYGILGPAGAEEPTGEAPFLLSDLVEKPGPEKAPSHWAVSARYVLSPEIFDALEECRKALQPGEELQLTDAIRALIGQGRAVYGVPLTPDEFRLDVGGFVSYGRAFTRMLVTHPKYGPRYLEYLRRLVAFCDGTGRDPDAWSATGPQKPI